MPWIGNGVSAIWRRKRKLEDLVEVDFDRTDHGELKIDQRYDLPIVSEHVHLAEIAVVEHLPSWGGPPRSGPMFLPGPLPGEPSPAQPSRADATTPWLQSRTGGNGVDVRGQAIEVAEPPDFR
jgi:hypothetical protein